MEISLRLCVSAVDPVGGKISEYHEWLTVERVLTPEVLAEVESLSNHIEVSSIRAEKYANRYALIRR